MIIDNNRIIFSRFLLSVFAYNFFVVCKFADILAPNICNIFQLLVVLYVFSFIRIRDNSNFSRFENNTYLLLIIWFAFIVFNNLDKTVLNVGLALIDNQGLLCMALLSIMPRFINLNYLSKILHYSLFWVVLSFILVIYKSTEMKSLFLQNEIVHAHTIFEGIHTYLGGGLVFLILFQDLLPKKYRVPINILAVFYTFSAAILGRRGILLLYFCSYLCYVYIRTYLFKKKNNTLFCILIIAFIIYYIISNYGEELFPFLYNRLLDDTRTETENELIQDLSRSNDMILGRGLSGTYKSYFVDEYNRNGIETGYLNMVLKGGWIYVIIYGFFVIPAIIKGLFYSNNYIVKMLAIYCTLWLIYFNTASSNMSFSIRYVFFLFGIFICYNSFYREINNEEINKYIN